MRDVRSLLLLAFGLAHDVSETCLDIEHEIGQHRYYGAQVADTGVTVLAHIACADASYPPYDAQTRLDLARSLSGARARLDELRGLLKTLSDRHILPASRLAPIRDQVEQLMALVRAIEAEVRNSARLAS